MSFEKELADCNKYAEKLRLNEELKILVAQLNTEQQKQLIEIILFCYFFEEEEEEE
jgi:hypothetical protein